MNDPEFLQSVLQVVFTMFNTMHFITTPRLLFTDSQLLQFDQNLPGVDPDSEAVRAAMGAMKVPTLTLVFNIHYPHPCISLLSDADHSSLVLMHILCHWHFSCPMCKISN